jgi:ADP-dependent NAD(P)H-hydrate dehydratase / NAD(P)H-hydrate epimerase
VKVVTAKEMARIEARSFDEGASDEEFMRAAGTNVAQSVERYITEHRLPWRVNLLCGKGNNGGDAYVAGLALLRKGFTVRAFQTAPLPHCSPLCQRHGRAFQQAGGDVRFSQLAADFAFLDQGVILDGLLGTGFHGQVQDTLATAIETANRSGLPILAIDIPSGLSGDTGEIGGRAILAKKTLFLGLPKTGFFLYQGWNQVGVLEGINFGLPESYVDKMQADFYMATEQEIASLLPPLVRSRHKYQAGYVVGWAGSLNMLGAAILSTYAALRGGAGIVRLLHREEMQNALTACHPEIVRQPYNTASAEALIAALNQSGAAYIGPGLGTEDDTKTLLKKVLPAVTKPLVIDADALNIIAQDASITVPSQAILTPHWGEMSRLLGIERVKILTVEILQKVQQYADQKNVIVVLKGAPTFVCRPHAPAVVVPRGDPGMATAGSGDVLTGLIAAFLAQGMKGAEAALLGVYVHAMAGEQAARLRTSYGVVASDIIEAFAPVFQELIELHH